MRHTKFSLKSENMLLTILNLSVYNLMEEVLKAGQWLRTSCAEAIEAQERLEKEIVVQRQVFESKSQEMQMNGLKEIDIQEIELVEVEVTIDD